MYSWRKRFGNFETSFERQKVQERKLKDQVDHLLRFVYSSDTCADKDAKASFRRNRRRSKNSNNETKPAPTYKLSV